MVIYQQTRSGQGVLADGAFVPENPQLPAWEKYQAFVAGGGIANAVPQGTHEEEQDAAIVRIDADAERQRGAVLGGATTLEVRRLRIEEAVVVEAGSGPFDAADYPFLAAVIGDLGATLEEVATQVLADRDATNARWAAIEQVASATRALIRQQSTVDAVHLAVEAVAWPNPPQPAP